MKGLSTEIEYALNTIIEGLNYNFFATEGMEEEVEDFVQNLDAEKMKVIMESKVTSFDSAKKLLERWMNSANTPSKKTIKRYLEKLVDSGENAKEVLRKALAGSIDYEKLEPHKHNSAIKAKPLILEAIFDLDASIRELKDKLESEDFSLAEVEFKLGYPERFAKGEFFSTENYYKNPLKDGDVKICPFGTEGKRIVLTDLGIILPKKPKKKDILFSDLPKKEQYWRRPELPEINPENVDNFADFIKEEFRRRVEGVWFMNNGEAVYLTGHHYFALTYFRMLDDGDFMKFRYAQMNMFYHLQACIVDPRCLGQLFGKSRRTGFTYAILAILLNWSTSRRNAKFGIMSKTGDDGQEAFMKYSYAFQSLPFWFMPIVQGKQDSTSHLHFSAPADNSKSAKKKNTRNINDYLNTMTDWRRTSNGAYDSIKLNGYLLDEVFKITKPNDIITHLAMITPTMMPNNGTPVGTMFAGSTMGKHKEGGSEGIELIMNSKVTERDPITGKTGTGLYFHFLPAQENMEDYTDIYGYCHQEKPKSKTYNVKGEEIKMGSLDFLIATEAQKKKQSDLAYNEWVRTYPRTVEHMMRDEATECVFNMTKLNDQIEHNMNIPEESRYMVGDFEWVDGKDTDVQFYPNSQGRFKVAWLPSKVDGTEALANRVRERNGKYYPMNGDVVRFGCDPFSAKSTHGEGSKGGIHGKTLMFPEGGAPSNKFVVEYIARPPDETIFFEDVIKVIRFYGAPILVESNRLDLLRHMRNRGYRGFAMNRLDRTKDQLNANELEYGGQTMSGKDMLDSHMNSIGSWIQKYVGYITEDEDGEEEKVMGDMPFNETLRDWLAFDPDKRTKYDATISSGLAIMACSTEKYRGVKKRNEEKKAVTLFRKYSNSGNISKRV